MNLEELIVRLRIEEDNRSSEKRGFNLVAKANVVEQGQGSKNKKPKLKLGPKGGISKNKFQLWQGGSQICGLQIFEEEKQEP